MAKDKSSSSVLAITGGQEVFRKRFLGNTVKHLVATGFRIEYADAAQKGDLTSAMTQGGSIFDSGDQKIAIIVSNPEKADLNLLKEHFASGDSDVVLILDYPGEPRGNTRFGIFLKTLGKFHSNHPLPSVWQADEVASKFCVDEAKNRGKTLDPSLAASLVKTVGTDIGFLTFEILKISMLASIEGSDVILESHIKDSMAVLTEASVAPLMKALAARNRYFLAKSLFRIRKTSRGDPTMRISGLIWSSVSKWLAISELMSQGVSASDGAARLKINPWYYEKKLVPQVQLWPRSDVVKLIKVLSGAERTVMTGGIDPWAVLVAGLLGVCGGSR